MAQTQKGREVSRVELAEIFGVAKTTVDAWVQRGCPAAPSRGRGKERRFNTADVHAWVAEDARSTPHPPRTEGEQELRLRKLAAEVGLSELKVKHLRESVAPADEFAMASALQNAEIRKQLLEVPERVYSQLAGETSEARFKRILEAELVQALEIAASADIEIDSEG